ncbi:hypothetical protein KP509_07G048200 [Ceratopteris richardii]|uniref:Protein kinase domain-containing protein n=1 Tax=Ceratopteris richardii TaxID=49495 RepID=A0A8T2UAQ4_CERRI|nr:hypothetical protein KP509_07G048200 [Ceratopteris richardii]KAH7432967.1 hypothetical protein KP509_07G048200 [Ceratopteris richardii]
MSEPVELILEFLRRHRFPMAEAALKAELLTRGDDSRHITPPDYSLHLNPQSHSPADIQNNPITGGTTEEQNTVKTGGEHNLDNCTGNATETFSQDVWALPEKQLYVEYELGVKKILDSSSPISQRVASDEISTTLKDEAIHPPNAEQQVAFPVQTGDKTSQGTNSTFSGKDKEVASSVGSEKRFHVEHLNPSCKEEFKQDVHALMNCNEDICQQQNTEPRSRFLGSQLYSINERPHEDSQNVDLNPVLAGPPCVTLSFTPQEGTKHYGHENQGKELVSSPILQDQQIGVNTNWIECNGVSPLQTLHVISSDTVKEKSSSEFVTKVLLPCSLQNTSNTPEQIMAAPERNMSDDVKTAMKILDDDENTASVVSQLTSSGNCGLNSQLQTLPLDISGTNMTRVLPRLPPVRLHFDGKNMDPLMKEGLYVDHKTLRSTSNGSECDGHDMGKESFGFGMADDLLLGHEQLNSGPKRSTFRPSVSQGIVGAFSDQMYGFTNVADGWYTEEYCGSDTYEDDDDPGYTRQPIQDEEWFLAHEIDYPTDDERSKQYTDKHTLKNVLQSRRGDEDNYSFGEESYFSGEDYYRLHASNQAQYKTEEAKLMNLEGQHSGSINVHSPHIDSNSLALLEVDNRSYNRYSREAPKCETEVQQMQSQLAWKGFVGHPNDIDEGDKVSTVCADGIDDDYHGSVRSGGVFVSSDIADVGSEVRDSLPGGSSEGEIESFKDQELDTFKPADGAFDPNKLHDIEKDGCKESRNSSMHPLEEGNIKHDMLLQYYNEAWGLCKKTDKQLTTSVAEAKEQLKGKHLTDHRNMGSLDNGSSLLEGFSFPSPSSTGEVPDSTAGPGKSYRLNRGPQTEGDGVGGYDNDMIKPDNTHMIGPDKTLSVWKQKSNNSSPIICSNEDNLKKLDLPNHANGSLYSTFYYGNVEAKKNDSNDGPESGRQLLTMCPQPTLQEEEDLLAGHEEIRALSESDEQYEIFDLRIVHRKNRTGFEEDKDFPILINSIIAGRYHVTEYLGSAAFSKAIQAHDLHTGMDVCMKIIKNNKDFFDQSLDEIKLLKFVNMHDPVDKYHILRLYDYFYHREHLFIVCELLRANLYEFHKFNRESGGEVYFTMPRLQSITRQCLEALEFLHRLGIIHCDLKPENILVKSYSRCEIKIIDLGSSCFQTDHLCSYVQSRSYRAPEVILGLPYDSKIDIWSLGCILAELCTGNVLFQNDSLATLLARVVGILGPIDLEVLASGRDTYKYFTKSYMIYERNQDTDQLEYLIPKRTSLSHRLPMGDEGFVEFVRYLLQSNPSKRPTASEALLHPWLSYPYEPISS